jgi:hypothetical protein
MEGHFNPKDCELIDMLQTDQPHNRAPIAKRNPLDLLSVAAASLPPSFTEIPRPAQIKTRLTTKSEPASVFGRTGTDERGSSQREHFASDSTAFRIGFR